MKKMKRVIAVILAVSCMASALCGCGNKKQGNSGDGSKTNIEISYWNSGLGEEWLKAMIKAFEAAYPEYKVTYTASPDASATKASLANPESSTVDLYLSTTTYDTSILEPLDDVLNSTVEGESKTIREKINPSYLAMETFPDGKVYTLTYGGSAIEFVYNKDLFAKAGIKTIPRTSNELVGACDKLAEANITPMCHFKTAGYWDTFVEAWYMQYEGADYYYNNFYGCIDENGKSPSKEVLKRKDGRYEILEACEKLLVPEYVLAGSNSTDHVTIQTMFLQGQAAMMLNGGWLQTEMNNEVDMENFGVMKAPVLSAITDKLDTVKKESDLRKLISAIDAVTDGEKEITEYQEGDNYNVEGMTVSAADWEYVRKARNTIAANFSGENMFIPTCSDAKEGAKEFIKFMYSDEGYKIYTDSLHMLLPLSLDSGEIDATGWNTFEKGMKQCTETAEQMAYYELKGAHPIFTEGGAALFAWITYVNKFCTNNAGDRKTAEYVWALIESQIEHDYESNWLANIGK